ncbi:MAG: hypothetical protein KAH77_10970 [Thiomargarita sp.]|nr:hypothetical protein [Thiomargarita sp.]
MNIDETLIKNTEAEYGAQYHQHAIDIYKMYVELTDALSARRQSVNSFFLSINSFIIGLLGYGHITIHKIASTPEFFWIISLLGMTTCVVWFKSIHSYKNIMRSRFIIIQRIEQQLPLAAYEAEWQLLQSDKGYQPLTHFEMVVPWIFFVLNLAISLKVTFPLL